ncbi:MAG: hypothetical protein NVS1B4_17210 [Gemmatimonadaceae bacterium]
MFRRSALPLVVLALAAAPVSAQEVGHFEIGSFGGYTAFDPSLALRNQQVVGGRVSFLVGSGVTSFVLEGDGSMGKQLLGTKQVNYTVARARVLYNASLVDHISVLYGIGGVHNHVDLQAWEWGISPMVGMRFGLGDFAAIRIDGFVDFFPNPANKSSSVPATAHYGGQAGLSIPIWRSRESAPPPVAVAPPPPSPTPAPAPIVAAKPVIADPALVDSDNDGVPDAFDRCPNTPAGVTVDRFGCPIKSEPAPVSMVDSDHDGVPDAFDKCPNTPLGTKVDALGCPILFKEKESTVTLRGVNFAPARAMLLSSSRLVLDDVALALIAHPDIRIEVAGHTDNRGKAGKNWRLSRQRAEAVRVYLAARGVALSRMIARGYGDAEPAATNATARGRAVNRRVELRKID